MSSRPSKPPPSPSDHDNEDDRSVDLLAPSQDLSMDLPSPSQDLSVDLLTPSQDISVNRRTPSHDAQVLSPVKKTMHSPVLSIHFVGGLFTSCSFGEVGTYGRSATKGCLIRTRNYQICSLCRQRRPQIAASVATRVIAPIGLVSLHRYTPSSRRWGALIEFLLAMTLRFHPTDTRYIYRSPVPSSYMHA